MLKITLRNGSGEAGVAASELAIILPFLLLLAFGSLEFARALHFSKMVTTLSREAANQALRECSPVWEAPDPCLEDVRLKLEQYANNSLSLLNVQVIVSLYRWDGTTAELIGLSPAAPAPPRLSQVCPEGGSCPRPISSEMVEKADLVAVGEVYSDYEPVVSALPDMFSFNPEVLYEVTFF